MPTMNVSREIEIQSPIEEVIPLIRRFEHWPSWSPWLCQEREAEVLYNGEQGEVGSGYSWNGSRIGAGSMSLLSANASSLRCDLNFLKPFKSHAEVGFELKSLGDKNCSVSWSMESKLPFFLFFMRQSFERFIGLDYERGLSMLKELAENGEVVSRISIEPLSELHETDYIGVSGRCKLADLGPAMQEHFPKLGAALAESSLTQNGPVFCHYRVMDPIRDHWEFTTAMPVSGDGEVSGVERGTRAAIARCAHIRHTGKYIHLGNAWATAFGWIRAEKHRQLKKHGGFEVYLDDPAQTPASELRTDIYVPLK